MNTMSHKKLIAGVSLIVAIAVFMMVRFGSAFTGPSNPGGTGVGALGIDASNNISVGTSTPVSLTKLSVVASSTTNTNYALKVLQPNGTPLLTVRNDGVVGINTAIGSGVSYEEATRVGGDLYVSGNVNATTFSGALSGTLNASNVSAGVFAVGNFAFRSSLGIATTTQVSLPQPLSVYGNGYVSGSLGIGTVSPGSTLEVNGNIAVANDSSIRSAYDFGNYFKPYTTAGAMTFTTGNSPRLTITYAGNVGIGTSTPQALLSVGNTTSALVAVFGGGSGKIDVGTIDPVYTIGKDQYATYLPGMTGVNEETTGVANLACEKGVCKTVIDFARAEQGSDIWLFGKVTQAVKQIEKVSVILSAGFDGPVWYEKDVAAGTITIFGKPTGNAREVSYRLSAPRFDASSWPNKIESEHAGFILPE
jgi:hypothetical protein